MSPRSPDDGGGSSRGPAPLPPRWLERLLGTLVPPSEREYVLGDLREEYRATVAERGRRAAWLAYAREVALTAPARLGAGGRRGARRGLLDRVRLGGGVRHVRFALRGMRHRPGQAGLIVLTLSAGIGATTGVYSIVDHVLLRPLPYERPHEIYDVWNVYTQWRNHEVLRAYWDRIALSYPEYETWRTGQTSFREVAIHGAAEATLTGRGDPTRVVVGRSTASLFPLLGVSPALGRAYADEEDGHGASAVALLSHDLWVDRWGADPGALGGTVELDGDSYEIIGILPAAFRFGPIESPAEDARVSVWIPVGADGADLEEEGNHAYEAVARTGVAALPPGAIEETRRLLSGGRTPDVRDVRVTPRRDEEVGAARGPLLLLLGAVSLLMLIACVNVATLFLGDVAGRRSELATRAALGAGRARLLGQLAIEALVYGALATAGGFALGQGLLRALLRWAPPGMAVPDTTRLDLRVLGVMAGVGLLASLVFGLLPGVLLRRLDLHGELKRGPGRTIVRGWRVQRVLVGAQFGLSVVLLVFGGLLARSLAAELGVDPGFDGEGLLSIDISLPEADYPTAESRSAFVREVTDRIGALPAVSVVSGATALPFSGRGGSSSFDIRGREAPEGTKKPEAIRRSVLPGFHAALGIPLLRGRAIDARDRDDAPPVAVVSRSMAERFWPGETAVGDYILRDGRAWEVVGVVDDVLTESLRAEPQPTFYTPLHQEEADVRRSFTLVLGGEDPGALVPGVRRAIWEIDPALALDAVEAVPEFLSRSLAPQRYRTFLLSLFALLATLLSASGAFGVVARSLVHRTRDLGIRLALGARPSRLMAQEVGREAVAVATGVGLGVVAAAAAARVLNRFLFGVSSLDPLTYGATVAGLVGLGLVVAWLAARRILRLDPIRVLRSD